LNFHREIPQVHHKHSRGHSREQQDQSQQTEADLRTKGRAIFLKVNVGKFYKIVFRLVESAVRDILTLF